MANRLKIALLSLFLIFPYCQLIGQVPKSMDSLKVFLKTKPQDTLYMFALNEYAFLTIKEGKYAEAEKIIKQMADLSAKLDYGTGYYKTVNMRGIVEYSRQNPQKAMEYFNECNEIIKKYNLEKKYFQTSLNNISIIYNQLGDRENATKYAMELIEYQEKNKLEPFKTSPYDQIGQNLKFYKKYDEALVYFQKMLALETRYRNYSGMGMAENNIANLYDDLRKSKEAIKHYKMGLTYAEKDNYKLLQTDFLTNLGRMYKNEKDFVQAEKYLKKSERLSRELDATISIGVVCRSLGNLYSLQKKYSLSEKYYLEALALSKGEDNPEALYLSNTSLAELYEEMKDFKKAYYYKVNAEAAKDSTFKIETAKNTEDLLRKYEAAQKEQKIALLNAENEKKSLQNKGLLVGGILVLLLAGTSTVFFINRTKLKRLQEAQKLRNRIAADLHDEIGSTLSSILLISGMAKNQNEGDKSNRMFSKIHSDSQHVMESVDEIIWSVSPVNDSLQGILLRLREYAQPLAESKNMAFELKADPAIETLQLPMEVRRNLYLIVKEAINNLVKYSGASEGSVHFKEERKKLAVTIKDNGKGFDTSASTTRNGLKNIRIRAQEIDGELSIESATGGGTEITLRLLMA